VSPDREPSFVIVSWNGDLPHSPVGHQKKSAPGLTLIQNRGNNTIALARLPAPSRSSERADPRLRRYEGILEATPPANLPIEQAVKFDLVVNLKSAKRVGIGLPTSLLMRADGVIE